MHDYQALNVINRVPAFTLQDSVPKDSYFDKSDINYQSPSISSIEVMAFKREVVEQEIICKDSILQSNTVMICDALGKAIKKRKFKGFRLDEELSNWKFV